MIKSGSGLLEYAARGYTLSLATVNLLLAVAVSLSLVSVNVALPFAILMAVPFALTYNLFFGGMRGILLGYVIFGVAWASVRAGVVSRDGSVTALGTLLAILIFVGTWTYANAVVLRNRQLARRRIDEIEGEDSPSTDAVIEKGVLLHSILRRDETSLETLRRALAMPGGEAFLWYLAAVALGRMKKAQEQSNALDRAASGTPDARLAKRIERLRKTVQSAT